MTETTGMLIVHGFTPESELNYEYSDSDLLADIDKIMPDEIGLLYDFNSDSEGVYTVEYTEVTEYTEA